jgi:FlaA1/EpsC-like NDP-sugar epimerase
LSNYAELIVQELNGNNTKFISVRFGNVIGSNGSVIPLFKKQIAEGGPVTVTHPDVARYFMSISEAVQLVMIAGAMGNGGEIFLLDMGKPVKIVDIAKELIIRSGMEPEKDVDVVFTGLRPGEKLLEELYWQGQGIISTENKKITMLKTDGLNSKNILSKIDILEEYISKRDTYDIVRIMQEIVPEAKLVNILQE